MQKKETKTITKQLLLDKIYLLLLKRDIKITKKDIAYIYADIEEMIFTSLKKGFKLKLFSFGSLLYKKRKSKNLKNQFCPEGHITKEKEVLVFKRNKNKDIESE